MTSQFDETIQSQVQRIVERGEGFSLFECPLKISSHIHDFLKTKIPKLETIRSRALREPPVKLTVPLFLDIHEKDARRDAKSLYNQLVRLCRWEEKRIFLTSPDSIEKWHAGKTVEPWKGNGKIDWDGLYFEQLLPLLKWDNPCFPDLNELIYAADDKSFMTYIERKLAKTLDDLDIEYEAQATIDQYQVDFLVHKDGVRIVVECDGALYHSSDEAKRRDAERDSHLERLGFLVLRFTGSEIVNDGEGCGKAIERSLAQQLQRSQPKPVNLDELDDSQKRAVHLSFKAARVLAPAGSGKTRVLINRGVQLRNEGLKQRRVLALAFNRKAREEMEKRLSDKGLNGINVCTFHSFGRSVLTKDAGLSFPKGDELPQVEYSDEYTNKLYELIEFVGVETSKDPNALERLRAATRRTKDRLKHPGDCLSTACRNSSGFEKIPAESHPKWSLAFEKFLKWQMDRGFLTFTDMVYLAVRKLAEDSQLRRKYQRKYDAILVDEFQDLNAAQHALIEILVCPHAHLFVVGDDDQTIYSWRGALMKRIRKFTKRYPGSEDIRLSTNYRCAKKIVRHTNWLIEHNRGRVEKEIKPDPNKTDGIVEEIVKDSLTQEAETAVQKLLEAHEGGWLWRKLAILSRYKETFPTITSSLEAAGIPFKCQDHPNPFCSRAVKVTVGYLAAVLDWPNPPREIWEDILRAARARPIGLYLSNDIIQKVVQSQNPVAFLQSAEGLRTNQREGIKRLLTKLRSLHEEFELRRSNTEILLEKIDSRFDLIAYFTDKSDPSHRTDNESNEEIFIEYLKDLAGQYPEPREFLEHCLQQIKSSAENNRKLPQKAAENKDAVQVMTIHKAKGKEWRGVVLFHLEDKDHPQDDQRYTAKDILERDEEERRIIYVGATRAKEALWVTAKRGTESQFFKELFVTPEYVNNKTKLTLELQQCQEKIKYLIDRCSTLKGELESLELRVCDHLDEEGIPPDMLDNEDALRRSKRRISGRIGGFRRHLSLLQRGLWWFGIKPEAVRKSEWILKFLEVKLDHFTYQRRLKKTREELHKLRRQHRLLAP